MKVFDYLFLCIRRLRKPLRLFTSSKDETELYALERMDQWKVKICIRDNENSNLRMHVYSMNGRAFVRKTTDDFTIVLEKGNYLIEVKEEELVKR